MDKQADHPGRQTYVDPPQQPGVRFTDDTPIVIERAVQIVG
jgi:hypothetical protein